MGQEASVLRDKLKTITTPQAEKEGAGLLFCCDGQVLLLLRNSRHNNNTWGLPGGNREWQDDNLKQTATRESTEEMGPLPKFEIRAEILTRRGARDQKLFTVYICTIPMETKATWKPVLNHEHHEAKWFRIEEAMSMADLHPVPARVFAEPHRSVFLSTVGHSLTGAASSSSSTWSSGTGDELPKKRGAALLLHSQGSILLLKRSAIHKHRTWELPGGKEDPAEDDLLQTAIREAKEQLGRLPEYTVRGHILTKRGRGGHKECTVYVCDVAPAAQEGWSPQLSQDHTEYRWFELRKVVCRVDLHPAVETVLKKRHAAELAAAFAPKPECNKLTFDSFLRAVSMPMPSASP